LNSWRVVTSPWSLAEPGRFVSDPRLLVEAGVPDMPPRSAV
jgi:hypothetical protein